MIDLHTHSTVSDGALTPSQLIARAASLGLTAIALTDHDTVSGLHEARRAAVGTGVRVIPGIEIEVEFPPGEFHLLGLGMNRWDGSFERYLVKLNQRRHERNLKILRNIRAAGIPATFEELREIAGEGVIGRPHIARLLVNKGVVRNIGEAFHKYLGKGMKFYEPREALILEEAAALIHGAGGKAIIAHPLSLCISLGKLPAILTRWIDFGIDGLEAYHSNATLRECRRLETIALGLGLIVTAGSDFHGDTRPDRQLGKTAEGMEIPDSYLAPFENSM